MNELIPRAIPLGEMSGTRSKEHPKRGSIFCQYLGCKVRLRRGNTGHYCGLHQQVILENELALNGSASKHPQTLANIKKELERRRAKRKSLLAYSFF